jgi:DNA-binding GntR family transcriptional regulator
MLAEVVPRLPSCVTNWLDGPAASFEWVENLPLLYPAKRKRPTTTRERKRDAVEHRIVEFLILSGAPLTIAGMAAMLGPGVGCSVVADAAYRLEQQGIVKRATRSRMLFLTNPLNEGKP